MPSVEERLSRSGVGDREPGERSVETPIVCALTRFSMRGAHNLLPSYREFRRLAQAARDAEIGLLASAFLIESPTTWYSLSIWRDASSIPLFGTAVPAHVEAARRGFGRLRSTPDRRPELWSTKWRLYAVSNNLCWDGLDLEMLLRTDEKEQLTYVA